MHAVQGFNEQDRVVVKSSNSHLQTHGPQLTTLHPPHQPLHDQLHEQRDTLRRDTVGGQLEHKWRQVDGRKQLDKVVLNWEQCITP